MIRLREGKVLVEGEIVVVDFRLFTDGMESSVEVTDAAVLVPHGGDSGGDAESSMGMMLCIGVHVGRAIFLGVYAPFFFGAERDEKFVFLFPERVGFAILAGSGANLVGDKDVLAEFATANCIKLDALSELFFLDTVIKKGAIKEVSENIPVSPKHRFPVLGDGEVVRGKRWSSWY